MKIRREIDYWLLRRFNPRKSSPGGRAATEFTYAARLKRIVGSDGWQWLRGQTVLDYGCGAGIGSVELAEHGVKRIIGIDIQSDLLDAARQLSAKLGVADRCTFSDAVDERVDVIVSMDAFEHFADPAAVLQNMQELLHDNGAALISFGPTWYHPRGGHTFSAFPWSHLLFSEEAQIRRRADLTPDQVTSFAEVPGGLNRMTIRRFIRLVEQSGFRFDHFQTIPARRLRWVHNRLTREFTTALVECKLVKRTTHAAITGSLRRNARDLRVAR